MGLQEYFRKTHLSFHQIDFGFGAPDLISLKLKVPAASPFRLSITTESVALLPASTVMLEFSGLMLKFGVATPIPVRLILEGEFSALDWTVAWFL